jgi:repressor LexA
VEDLTAVQRKALQFIHEHALRRNHAPTLRELCEHMGYSAVGSAQDIVATLRRKGYLESQDRQFARSLIVTAMARSFLTGELEITDGSTIVIPCLGTVPAGHPREAIENSIGNLAISNTLLPKKIQQADRLYALRATGASMQGAGIHDGDWLVVRYQDAADIGQIVVARMGEEVTVKRLMHNPENGWYLRPENEAFTDIYASECPFQISGLVVALQRSLS